MTNKFLAFSFADHFVEQKGNSHGRIKGGEE